MSQSAFRNMRVVGAEDGRFRKGVSCTTALASVLMRASKVEEVEVKRTTVDGLDAPSLLVEALSDSCFA